jgi:hypothetical protein
VTAFAGTAPATGRSVLAALLRLIGATTPTGSIASVATETHPVTWVDFDGRPSASRTVDATAGRGQLVEAGVGTSGMFEGR